MKRLGNSLKIRRESIDRWFTIDRDKLETLCLIQKSNIAFSLLYIGIIIAYLGSMSPWFMWKVSHYYPLIASMPIVMAWLISRTLKDQLFTRRDYKYPLIAYLIIALYMAIVNEGNMNGFIIIVFNSINLLAIFSLKVERLAKLMKWLCVTIAVMMLFSIPCYVMYLLGFSLPYKSVENEDLMYSFYNYYFFLLDNRFTAETILPRFHSVFLEPGHLGSACVFLLLTQISKWKKWYNIVLFITTLMTFSLAAYLLLVVLYFIGLWVRGRNIWLHLIVIVALLTAGGIFAYNYNKGNNLVNMFILERLEIDKDGKFVGDNRVTEEFDDEFDDFISSDDILFGRKYENAKYGWGNSGYRVFIYDYGIVFVMLLLAFYITCSLGCINYRVKLAMFAFGIVTFWARSTLLDYFDFLPLYSLLFVVPLTIKRTANRQP